MSSGFQLDMDGLDAALSSLAAGGYGGGQSSRSSRRSTSRRRMPLTDVKPNTTHDAAQRDRSISASRAKSQGVEHPPTRATSASRNSITNKAKQEAPAAPPSRGPSNNNTAPSVEYFHREERVASAPPPAPLPMLTQYGPSIIQSLHSATGTGSRGVVQVMPAPGESVPRGPSSVPLPPSQLWSTNVKAEPEGASCVVLLHVPSIRVRSQVDPEHHVRTDVLRDVYLQIVTDQRPSPGGAVVVSSSHHHSSGFITIAKQRPFVPEGDSSSHGRRRELLEVRILLKATLLAPYLKITVPPRTGVGLGTIRIVHVSITTALSESIREVSLEPSHSVQRGRSDEPEEYAPSARTISPSIYTTSPSRERSHSYWVMDSNRPPPQTITPTKQSPVNNGVGDESTTHPTPPPTFRIKTAQRPNKTPPVSSLDPPGGEDYFVSPNTVVSSTTPLHAHSRHLPSTPNNRNEEDVLPSHAAGRRDTSLKPRREERSAQASPLPIPPSLPDSPSSTPRSKHIRDAELFLESSRHKARATALRGLSARAARNETSDEDTDEEVVLSPPPLPDPPAHNERPLAQKLPSPVPSPPRAPPVAEKQPMSSTDTSRLLGAIDALFAKVSAMQERIDSQHNPSTHHQHEADEAPKTARSTHMRSTPPSPSPSLPHHSQPFKGIWDDTRTVTDVQELLVKGCGQTHEGGLGHSSANPNVTVHVPVLVQLEIPGGPAALSADDVGGYLAMPYRHFILGVGEDASNSENPYTYLGAVFAQFLGAIKGARQGNVYWEALCRCKQGFCVRVDAMTFTVLTVSPRLLLGSIRRFNELNSSDGYHHNRRQPTWSLSRGLHGSGGATTTKGCRAQLHVACWLDYPTCRFEEYFDEVVALRGVEEGGDSELPKLGYFTTAQYGLDGEGVVYGDHPLIPLLSPSTNTSLRLPPTSWGGMRLEGRLTQRPSGALTTPDLPNTGAFYVSFEAYTPSAISVSVPRPTRGGQTVDVVLYDGHLLDLVVGPPIGGGSGTTCGIAMSARSARQLSQIVGPTIWESLSNQGSGKAVVVDALARLGNGGGLSSLVYAMAAALEHNWDCVGVWWEDADHAPSSTLIEMCARWPYQHPRKVVLCSASAPFDEIPTARLHIVEHASLQEALQHQ